MGTAASSPATVSPPAVPGWYPSPLDEEGPGTVVKDGTSQPREAMEVKKESTPPLVSRVFISHR
jgi:hypothetical protein